MSTMTSQNVVVTLEKHQGPLSAALRLEDFAEPGGLADQLATKWTDRRSKEQLKATQLRRFFHTIKKVERSLKGRRREDSQELPASVRRDLLPVMPELAYARGRELIPNDFYLIMKTSLRPAMLETVGDFRLLVDFLTAILAYHKLHEKVKG